MQCAVVLTVYDFAALRQRYGLDLAFTEIAACRLSQPYWVLVAEGFDRIPRNYVQAWKDRNIQIVDCSETVAALIADYPYLKALPTHPVHRVTLLRHLILERYFANEATLSADADIIWRVDPHELFGEWDGETALPGSSGSLVYVNSRDWFEGYRLGLESLLTGGTLTDGYEPGEYQSQPGINHDQQLIQHLQYKKVLRNQIGAFRSRAEMRKYWIVANPLRPRNGMPSGAGGLTYRKTSEGEFFDEAKVCYWHMQSSFVAMCGYLYIAEPMLKRHGGRLPFPKPLRDCDNIKFTAFHALRNLILRDQVLDPRLQRLKPMMFREGIYEAFFNQDLPERLFNDRVWWEPGVFAA